MNNILRKRVKIIKALQGVTYKELASYLEVTQDSFYSWLAGYYDLSAEKQELLKDVLDTLEE